MSNEIVAYFKGRTGVAESVYQYDYGKVLVIDGLSLPAVFEAHFANTGDDNSTTVIGQNNRVAIPNACLTKTGIVTVYIYLHAGENDGEVEYIIKFAVTQRARPAYDSTEEERSEFESAVQTAIAMLQNSKKVNTPLDEYNQVTHGTNGQLLRTKGDGSTEWVDEGLPTDEQTAQAVSEWLDDHPEATTTVQDGSITEQKLSSALKLKILKDYVSPEMFGAKGDGVTDDTDAINQALQAGSVLFDHGKTYLVSSDNGTVLIVPSNRIVDLNESAIQLALTDETTLQMLRLNNVENVVIKNGSIIGDRELHEDSSSWEYCHDIFVAGSSNVVLENLTIKDARGDGIYVGVSTDNIISKGLRIVNCDVDNCYRNGLTVTACNGGFVNGCSFNNSSGSNPQAGFDIEPNGNHVVDIMLDNIVCKGNAHVAWSVVNNQSNSFFVHIGQIESDSNYINIKCTKPSNVIIDSIFHDCGTNPAFYITNTVDTLLNITNAILTSANTISSVFTTDSGIANCSIDKLTINAPNTTVFSANRADINIHIGTLLFKTSMVRRTLALANIVIDKIIKAQLHYTEAVNLEQFDVNILFTNSESSLLTATVESITYTDGAVIEAYNNSEVGKGNARFATGDGSQTIINGETASNTVQIPSGSFIKMQYNKTAGKWYVLLLA